MYAHWRVDINTANVPEPLTTAALLGMTALAGLGFGAKRYLGRRKDE